MDMTRRALTSGALCVRRCMQLWTMALGHGERRTRRSVSYVADLIPQRQPFHDLIAQRDHRVGGCPPAAFSTLLLLPVALLPVVHQLSGEDIVGGRGPEAAGWGRWCWPITPRVWASGPRCRQPGEQRDG